MVQPMKCGQNVGMGVAQSYMPYQLRPCSLADFCWCCFLLLAHSFYPSWIGCFCNGDVLVGWLGVATCRPYIPDSSSARHNASGLTDLDPINGRPGFDSDGCV